MNQLRPEFAEKNLGRYFAVLGLFGAVNGKNFVHCVKFWD
jgi:hypothetical protein